MNTAILYSVILKPKPTHLIIKVSHLENDVKVSMEKGLMSYSLLAFVPGLPIFSNVHEKKRGKAW